MCTPNISSGVICGAVWNRNWWKLRLRFLERELKLVPWNNQIRWQKIPWRVSWWLRFNTHIADRDRTWSNTEQLWLCRFGWFVPCGMQQNPDAVSLPIDLKSGTSRESEAFQTVDRTQSTNNVSLNWRLQSVWLWKRTMLCIEVMSYYQSSTVIHRSHPFKIWRIRSIQIYSICLGTGWIIYITQVSRWRFLCTVSFSRNTLWSIHSPIYSDSKAVIRSLEVISLHCRIHQHTLEMGVRV